MIAKAYYFFVRLPIVFLVFTALISAFFLYQAKTRLFSGGEGLLVDSTVKPFISRESNIYEFFLDIRRMFGNEEILIVALQPENSLDFEFFQKLDGLTREISETIPNVSRATSLANFVRPSGACAGESYFHLPGKDGICESVFAQYRFAISCLDNISVSEEPGGKAVACARDIFRKGRDKIRDEAEEKTGRILRDILADQIILGDLISYDHKAVGVRIEFSPDAVAAAPKIQDPLAALLDRTRSDSLRVAYAGQSRLEYEAFRVVMDDIRKLLPLGILLISGTLVLATRIWRGMAVPFCVVSVGILWTIGIFSMTGAKLNLVTLALPPLLICVGCSYVVHVVNLYLGEAAKDTDKVAVVRKTVELGALPLSVTALTTLGGFAALIGSPIPAIKEFGIYSCVGIGIIIFLSLTLAPCVLALLPLKDMSGKPGLIDKVLDILAAPLKSHSRSIILGWSGVGCIAVLGILLGSVNSETRGFQESPRLRKDIRFIEERFAGTDVLRIVFGARKEVVGDAQPGLISVDTIDGLRKLNRWIRQKDGRNELSDIKNLRIDKIVSPVEFLELEATDQSLLTKDEITRFFEKQTNPRFLNEEGKILQMTIRMRVPGSAAYLEARKHLHARILEYLPHLKPAFTGAGILASDSADAIAEGQIESLGMALVVIFLILSLLFLSFRYGLVAFFPNFLVVAVFFGTLGWLSIPIGVSITVIASVAMGIGLEDTILFLTDYEQNARESRDRELAVQVTLKGAGKPMTYTALSLGLGFLVFIFSDMDSQVMFGVLMAFALLIGLIVNLHFFPAITARTQLITVWDYMALDYNREFIKRIDIFRDLSLSQTKIVTLMGYTVDLEPDEVLFEQNSAGREMFVVLEGEVQLHLNGAENRQKAIIGSLAEGQSFGEMGLFRSLPRTASVKAIGKTRLLALNEEVLTKLENRYSRIASTLFLNLARTLTEKNRDMEGRVAEKISGETWNNSLPSQFGSSREELRKLIDEIIADGVITHGERRKLNRRIYADHQIADYEQEELDRLNHLIHTGVVEEVFPRIETILQNLKPAQIEWLLRRFRRVKVKKGETVFESGDHGRSMIILITGRCGTRLTVGDEDYVVGTMLPGDLMGARAVFLADNVRAKTVVALEDSEYLALTDRDFQTLMRKNKKLAARFTHNLVCMLSNRVEQTTALIGAPS